MRTDRSKVTLRRTIRLAAYDYASPGLYFVTICTCRRACLFGDVVDAEIRLNDLGRLVADCWRSIPSHFPGIELDAFVVMPNHVHGVVRIVGGPSWDRIGDDPSPVGAAYTPPRIRDARSSAPARPTLGTVVATFKGAVTRMSHVRGRRSRTPIWQRNYYEHVIRNDASFERLRDYIAGNPAKWAEDVLNPMRRAAPGRPSPRDDIGRNGGAACTPPLRAERSRENIRIDRPRTHR